MTTSIDRFNEDQLVHFVATYRWSGSDSDMDLLYQVMDSGNFSHEVDEQLTGAYPTWRRDVVAYGKENS